MPDWGLLGTTGVLLVAVCVLIDRLLLPDRPEIWLRLRLLADRVDGWRFSEWHRDAASVGIRVIKKIATDEPVSWPGLRRALAISALLTAAVMLIPLLQAVPHSRVPLALLGLCLLLGSSVVFVFRWIFAQDWVPSWGLMVFFVVAGPVCGEIFYLITEGSIDTGRMARSWWVGPSLLCINLLLDGMTLYVTYVLLARVSRAGPVKSVVYVTADIVVAALLAFICFVGMKIVFAFSTDGGHIVWRALGREWVESLAALFTRIGDPDAVFGAYSATTLILTTIYLLAILVLATAKLGTALIRATVLRVINAVANPHDERDTLPFTVLALIVTVLAAIAKVVEELAKAASDAGGV